MSRAAGHQHKNKIERLKSRLRESTSAEETEAIEDDIAIAEEEHADWVDREIDRIKDDKLTNERDEK